MRGYQHGKAVFFNLVLKHIFGCMFLFLPRINYCDRACMVNYTIVNGEIKGEGQAISDESIGLSIIECTKRAIATSKRVLMENHGKKVWLRQFPKYMNCEGQEKTHPARWNKVRLRLVIEK